MGRHYKRRSWFRRKGEGVVCDGTYPVGRRIVVEVPGAASTDFDRMGGHDR